MTNNAAAWAHRMAQLPQVKNVYIHSYCDRIDIEYKCGCNLSYHDNAPINMAYDWRDQCEAHLKDNSNINMEAL